MISYVLPTRDRDATLARTLAALGRLPAAAHAPAGGGEVIVVDDASAVPVRVPDRLANGLPVRLVRLEVSIGAAARNAGAEVARGDWLVMLDDDSHPLDAGHVPVLLAQPPEVAAVGAEIVLASGAREAGGLPEVGIGCGLALRREVFVGLGGYDAAFHYYVEEYDLAARLLAAGRRTVHDRRFRVRHEKTLAGRDMDVILGRLVRNNGWVMARYAPEPLVAAAIDAVIDRYRAIAGREGATAGFERGLVELVRSLPAQPRRPLAPDAWDRFTGRTAAREGLRGGRRALEVAGRTVRTAAIVDPGKHEEEILAAAATESIRIVDDPAAADAILVGTLSPGPLLDAWERRTADADRPVLRAWAPLGGDARTVHLPASAPRAAAATG